MANLPKAFEPTLERSTTFIATYQPESDLTALIERYRTGPFRPVPQLYESVAHDESDVVFGIDLRKWAEGGWSALTSGEEKKDLVPPVLTALLDALEVAYLKLPNDAGTWLALDGVCDVTLVVQRSARRGYMIFRCLPCIICAKVSMLFRLGSRSPRRCWPSTMRLYLLVV